MNETNLGLYVTKSNIHEIYNDLQKQTKVEIEHFRLEMNKFIQKDELLARLGAAVSDFNTKM